jgi:beta-galactosidase
MKHLFVLSALVISLNLSAQQFYYGAAYYPEQAEKEQIDKDAKLMRGANFNLVRMGDFAWYNMEPKPGVYSFDWLQYALNTLAKEGISSMLVTPTAAIPKWMYDMHPEIMQVTADGQRKPYGKRRHACLNNEIYRNYCKGVAEAMAKTFADNPNLTGFQVDNELGAEEPYCYCQVCQKRFADWLRTKYKNVETLNKAWNTTFWSETLDSFNHAWLPRKGDNPSAFQDFQIFNSDCIIDFFNLQRDAIKAVAPNIKVSHNICSSGFLYTLDLYKLSRTCDFLSIDNYPYTWTLENEYGNKAAANYTPAMASLALSQIRGTKHAPFLVTEAQIGRTGGMQRNLLQPGIVRLWSHQEFAHGAEGICFFSWRTFSAAHEHLIAGVVEADNIPRRKYFEVQKTGDEIQKIFAVTGQLMPDSKAAVIRDFHCDWAFEDGRFSGDFRYMRGVFAYYSALREWSVTTDLISPDDDFSRYKLIVVPAQVVVSPDFGKRLQRAAQQGATVIITCMTGLRDENIRSLGTLVQKEICEMAGIEIEEQHALFAQKSTSLLFYGNNLSCGLWHDLFQLKTAQPVAFYNSQFFKGQPAITQNRYGKGNVFYVGTVPQQEVVSMIVQKAVILSGLQPLVRSADPQVEVTEVTSLKTGKHYVYVLNFSDKDQKVTLQKSMKDFNSGKEYSTELVVPATDYLLLNQ